MVTKRLLYIESDGQVYLVRRDGLWAFPEDGDKLPFRVAVRHATTIGGREVAFCRPSLEGFPSEWMFKDEVPLRRDVDPIVQRAINASLARCVVGVILRGPDGRILLVKSSRGFTKGMWNVPGGFIEYGEAPETAAVREAKEETGLEIALGPLIGVYTQRFESPYFMYGFMYEATSESAALRLEPSEIEAARWAEPEEAIGLTRNPFAQQAITSLFKLKVPRPTAHRRPRRGAP